MNDLLLAELEIALQRYERHYKLPEFILRFLYLLDHGMDLSDHRLMRIIPWCRRWIASTDTTEYKLLERKIGYVLDLFLAQRKFHL